MKSGITPLTNKYTTIPNHPGDMPKGTLKAILNQADVSNDEFLKSRFYKNKKFIIF